MTHVCSLAVTNSSLVTIQILISFTFECTVRRPGCITQYW